MEDRLGRLAKRAVDRGVGVTVNAVIRAYRRSPHYAEQWHPHQLLRRHALADTVEYIEQHMVQAMIRTDSYDVLTFASAEVSVEGMFLEFGVRTGNTINHIARANPGKVVHGFDSFEGLPEHWTGWTKDRGAFGGEGIPVVEPNVRLEIGWFDQSLPRFLQSRSDEVAFVHVDSDLYSSAKTILDNLGPRVVPGSVIVFNEYFNYPNWRQHEYKAFQEFCAEHLVEYEYLCWGLYEVAVKIVSIRGQRTIS